MNCLCVLSRCLRKSFGGSARRRAKRNPLPQIFKQIEYTFYYCGFTRSRSARYYMNAVFNGSLYRLRLILMQLEARCLFKTLYFVVCVNSEIGSLLPQLQKLSCNITLYIVIFLEHYGNMLARIIANEVAEHYHILDIVAHAVLGIFALERKEL